MSRRLNWGADATDAKYRTEDTGTPGDFVVAEDTDGNTVLLKYDDTAGEWVYGGPVNMSGSDISNVGELSSTSVSTEELSAAIQNLTDVSKSLGTWYQNTSGRLRVVSIEYSMNPSSGTSLVRMFGDVNNNAESPKTSDSETIVGTGTTSGSGGVNLLVPDGAYYRIRVFGDTGDGSLSKFNEGDFAP